MDIRKLNEWNPWWENKGLIDELKGIKREQYKDLINSVNIKEITIITGVRRAGKSTLMYQIIDNLLKIGIDPSQILFVNFEDNKLTEDTIDDIYQSYRENLNIDKKAYIFFDEINRRPGWESWIRKRYDLKKNDKFIISGSSSFLLKKEYSTLLTGRNLTFEVFPLDFKEFLQFNQVDINNKNIQKNIILEKTRFLILKNLKDYLNIGGFPAIILQTENYKIKVLEQYFDDILYKDIIDRHNLNSQKTKDLALYLMANFTNFISLRNLRTALGLSYDTIKDYISVFKEAFMFFTLDHFSYSFKEQKTLPSKIYCIDNGLRSAVSFKFSADYGKLAENLVLIELKRRGEDIYYWKNKGEVDFIIKDRNQDLIAINVTYTDEIEERESGSLLEFRRTFNKTKELIILTRDLEKKEKGIKYMPLWKWLLE